MICSVEDCAKTASRKGLCNAHYLRAWRYGDPLAGATAKGALTEWLKGHVGYAGDDCLTWPFGGRGNGYGSIKFNGRHTTANYAMCELAHGRAPSPTHEAAHSCGNGHLGCVNPRHLRWATRLENANDALRDGTTSRGESHADAIRSAFAQVPRAVRREAKRLDVPVETLTEEARSAA